MSWHYFGGIYSGHYFHTCLYGYLENKFTLQWSGRRLVGHFKLQDMLSAFIRKLVIHHDLHCLTAFFLFVSALYKQQPLSFKVSYLNYCSHEK